MVYDDGDDDGDDDDDVDDDDDADDDYDDDDNADDDDDDDEAPRRLRRDELRYKRETKQDKPSMPLSNNKTRQVIA